MVVDWSTLSQKPYHRTLQPAAVFWARTVVTVVLPRQWHLAVLTGTQCLCL